MIRIADVARTGRSAEIRKIVVKLGSNVVMGEDDKIDFDVIRGLADEIRNLHESKVEVVIVTSGAVGLGCGRMKRARPKTIPEKHELEIGEEAGQLETRRMGARKEDALDGWNHERASAIAELNGELLRKQLEEDRQEKDMRLWDKLGIWGR